MTLISVLRETFFADQGLTDNRQLLFSFVLPGIEGEWGFFPAAMGPWKTLVTVSSEGRVCVSAFCACMNLRCTRM